MGEEAYSSILRDAVARLPRDQRKGWRRHVKAYVDSLLDLYRSKSNSDELARKFQSVMSEQSQLKMQLNQAEKELLSLSGHEQEGSPDVLENYLRDPHGSVFLQKAARLDDLTRHIMELQVRRDRLHQEFNHELGNLRMAWHVIQRLHAVSAGCCCCSPLNAKTKAYMQMQAAVSDVVDELVQESVSRSVSGIDSCVSLEDLSASGNAKCPSEVSCIDDLGTMSETLSFYSCDEGGN